MTDNDQTRILNRIKKMLNLAGDAGATEGERDNALRMAYATMAKHNFDMAQVDAATGAKGGAAVDEKREQIDRNYRGLPWTRGVSMAIAQLFFCSYFYCKFGRDDRIITHSFVGRAANAITAAEMAAYIVESIHRQASLFARGTPSPGQAHRDFCKGAVEKITRRCYELRREAEATPVSGAEPGMALVLASFYDSEKEANKKFLVKTGVIVEKARGRERGASNYDSYRSGQAFGSTVSLNRQVTK